jgi:hypothetical protein
MVLLCKKLSGDGTWRRRLLLIPTADLSGWSGGDSPAIPTHPTPRCQGQLCGYQPCQSRRSRRATSRACGARIRSTIKRIQKVAVWILIITQATVRLHILRGSDRANGIDSPSSRSRLSLSQWLCRSDWCRCGLRYRVNSAVGRARRGTARIS